MWMKLNSMCIVSTIKSKDVYIPGIHTPPHGTRKRSAPPLPPKKEASPRPMKITKTCRAQWGKVDFNPLNLEGNYKEGSNFV